jgi:DNA-directed RNA polymerase specialized sigma24 family protein
MSMNGPPPYGHGFPQTKWSVVRLAVSVSVPGSERALNDLCRAYELPVHEYTLRSGVKSDDAEDLRQMFFVKILEKDFFAKADANKGKLRNFLLSHLKYFLVDVHRAQTALVRGGGRVVKMADLDDATAAALEPVDEDTPFLAYQRKWFETMTGRAMAQLRREYEDAGHQTPFEAIAPYLNSEDGEGLVSISMRFGRAVNTLKSDIRRLKKRCADIVWEAVAATLENPTPENIRAEIQELMAYKR